MEANDQNLQALSHYLEQTLSTDRTVRQAGASRKRALPFDFRKSARCWRFCDRCTPHAAHRAARAARTTARRAPRHAAEKSLSDLHAQPGYSLVVLTLLQRPGVPQTVLLAAAIEFKARCVRCAHAAAACVLCTIDARTLAACRSRCFALTRGAARRCHLAFRHVCARA